MVVSDRVRRAKVFLISVSGASPKHGCKGLGFWGLRAQVLGFGAEDLGLRVSPTYIWGEGFLLRVEG